MIDNPFSGFELIAEDYQDALSVVTQLTFSGLNSDRDGGYLIEMLAATGGLSLTKLHCNGDMTAANYRCHFATINNAGAVAAGVLSTPKITDANALGPAMALVTVGMDINGKFAFSGFGARDMTSATSVQNYFSGGSNGVLAVPITRLDIVSAALIDVRTRVYRKK